MNKKEAFRYGKRIFFTIFTQGLLSGASIIIGFGLPKFLNIDEYARWQLYYFYVAYVNYLQLGFNDGLILNLSGQSFNNLPWKNIKKSTVYIVGYLLMLSVFILLGGRFLNVPNYTVLKWLVVSIIPTVLMCSFSAVLLAGNKTYEYNLFSLLIKIVFVILLMLGLASNKTTADFYIWGDIISKCAVTCIFALYERKNMRGLSGEIVCVREFVKKNCKTGIIVATTVLILGLLPMCGRIVIQIFGTDNEYAWFSFAISMLSIILTFTNAIGTVAFPMLKNSNESMETEYTLLSKLYDEILNICMLGLGIIDIVIWGFLPEYASVLIYFPILFSACWPLGKIQIIVYPYYKLYRREKEFLKISLCSIVGIMIFSFWGYYVGGLSGLAWVAFLGISICYEVLNMYLEGKVLYLKSSYNTWCLWRTLCFMIIGMLLDGFKFMGVYLVYIIVYYMIFWKKYRNLKNIFDNRK